MNVTTPANGPAERRAATLGMACLGVFVAYLPVTTVAVSLPVIQSALNATTAQLSWVQDAFVLPMAAFILTAGVLGDVHGRKKVFLSGLLLSATGAAVALTAQSVQMLWIGQALAGLGAATLLPTTLALISHAVPDHRERGKFIGLWATSLMAALAVGPIVAGVILDHFAWRWIYLLAIPVSLIAAGIAARLLTDSRAPFERRLDWPGQITATVTVTALVYGVIEGGADSFAGPKVLTALAVAVVGGAAFVFAERRSDSPMLDLALFRSPAFTATTLVAMITFLALIGFFFLLSLYFGMVQRLDTLEAAWRLLVVTACALLVGGPVGRLMHRISARVLIAGGLLLVSASLFALIGVDADTSFLSLAWRLAPLGLGLGVVMTPMTATAVASVPHHLAGMAGAGNNAFRQVGGALGPAVLGALLTTRALNTFPAHLAEAGVTGPAGERVLAAADQGGLGAVAGLDLGADTGRTMGALAEAFLDGLRLCLTVAGSLTLLAALVALVLLRRPRSAGAGHTQVAASNPAGGGVAVEAPTATATATATAGSGGGAGRGEV